MRGLLPAAVIALSVIGPARAASTIQLACAPDLPFYCGNIHVGCSGRSTIETAPFLLELRTQTGTWSQAERRVEGTSHRDAAAVIFRPNGGRDWIRVQLGAPSGSYPYAERIYRDGLALMSRGRCWPDNSRP